MDKLEPLCEDHPGIVVQVSLLNTSRKLTAKLWLHEDAARARCVSYFSSCCMWFKGRHAGSCTDVGVLTDVECKGKVGKLNVAIARNVGDATDAWPCAPYIQYIGPEFFVHVHLLCSQRSFIIKTSQRSFTKYLIASGKLLAATVQVNPEI